MHVKDSFPQLIGNCCHSLRIKESYIAGISFSNINIQSLGTVIITIFLLYWQFPVRDGNTLILWAYDHFNGIKRLFTASGIRFEVDMCFHVYAAQKSSLNGKLFIIQRSWRSNYLVTRILYTDNQKNFSVAFFIKRRSLFSLTAERFSLNINDIAFLHLLYHCEKYCKFSLLIHTYNV